jgi:serine/threonine-protein kinase
MDEKGKRIADKYELVERAGAGGMATVWRAIQHGAAGFARPVGLKRIRDDLVLQPEFVKMFIEEARVSAELLHPNIVQIYDFGVEQGHYFLVMEWVEGLNLGRYLEAFSRQGRFAPWHLVVAIAIEALHALSAAHGRLDRDGRPAAVIHRDVTPPNILVGLNGVTKLTDFGLARAMDRARMTAPHVVKGKLSYLAPELTRNAMATAQSDIYSLGIVLWQAFASRKLFTGDTDGEVVLAARHREIPPLVSVRPDLPERLLDVVDCALARDPADRFDSALAMRNALAGVLRAHPEPTDARRLAESVAQARASLGVSAPSRPPPPVL